jgi:hypothetical protein
MIICNWFVPVIGRKLKQLLNDSHQLCERIRQILVKRPTTWWQAMLDGLNDDLNDIASIR